MAEAAVFCRSLRVFAELNNKKPDAFASGDNYSTLSLLLIFESYTW